MVSPNVVDMTAPKFITDRGHYGDALRQWFASKHPEWAKVEVTNIDIPVATGFSNETVFVSLARTIGEVHSEERYVVRIEPAGGALFPTQTAACEVSVALQHRAMATAAAHCEAPVPAVIGYEGDSSILGGPFFVMTHVDGQVPGDNPRYTQAGFVVDEATPQQRRRMVQTGLEAMAAINKIDWLTADLGWLDASGIAEPSTAIQIDIYEAHTTATLAGRPHPVLAESYQWLREHDPADERYGLTWGDARVANVLWQNYRPAAVLDWEAAALSPTEADIGWWLMFDRMSFDDLGVARLDGYPTREEQIDMYEQASGLEVRNPRYWEVFGIMRFAAIFIGLGDRMTSSGLVTADLNLSVANMVTDALARALEIDNPTPSPF